jgi:hypothetical protein
VDVASTTGDSEVACVTCWALMALGQSGLGKVPGAWSGSPLDVMVRVVALQVKLTVLVRLESPGTATLAEWLQ